MVAVLMIGLLGFTLVAEDPFSADWEAGITFDPNGTLVSGLESIVDLGYTSGPVFWTSYSEFQLTVVYLWQEFGMTGRLGAFEVQGNLLFGPSTTDFLYAQAIATLPFAGVDVGFYYAGLSGAVFGGPADGFALRLAGSVGVFAIVSITEMGARIEDDDFDGIDIVHAATGFHRHYTTDPVVPGQGFTGEKLTVSGWSFGCAENVQTVVYFTSEGFDFISFELEDIALGISWLTADIEITYELQTKSITLTPRVVVGDGLLCFEPYIGVRYGASLWEIDGIELGGLALACTWNGVTIKDLTVFDPGRYAITTEEYGSVIESLEDAIEGGHDYYGQYWELLSIEIVTGGCCGGVNRMLVNTYFEEGSSSIFGWGMSYFEAKVALSAVIELSGDLTVTANGLDAVGMGFKLHW
jgi:hypothetical protein